MSKDTQLVNSGYETEIQTAQFWNPRTINFHKSHVVGGGEQDTWELGARTAASNGTGFLGAEQTRPQHCHRPLEAAARALPLQVSARLPHLPRSCVLKMVVTTTAIIYQVHTKGQSAKAL